MPSNDLPSEDVDDESGVGHSHCGVYAGGVGDQELIGASALNLRLTLSWGHGWAGSGIVVVMCPLETPCNPCFRLSRSTVHRAGPPSFRRNSRQTFRAPYRPLLSLWTLWIVLRVSASVLDRSEAFPGSRATAAWAKLGRRSDQQDAVDRLDSVGLAMLFDERDHLRNRRSGFAWTKQADALFRISLAARNSLTSCSSSLILSLSPLLRPSRSPASRAAWMHHSRIGKREHPSFSAIGA